MTTTATATDEDFLEALEACTLPSGTFDHAAHVRAAYLYARAHDFPGAVGRMRRALLRLASALGKAEHYHETITVAFMALVAQRLYEHGDGGGFDGFARAHPELFDRDVLLRHFPAHVLQSDLARRVFVLPALDTGSLSPEDAPHTRRTHETT